MNCHVQGRYLLSSGHETTQKIAATDNRNNKKATTVRQKVFIAFHLQDITTTKTTTMNCHDNITFRIAAICSDHQPKLSSAQIFAIIC